MCSVCRQSRGVFSLSHVPSHLMSRHSPTQFPSPNLRSRQYLSPDIFVSREACWHWFIPVSGWVANCQNFLIKPPTSTHPHTLTHAHTHTPEKFPSLEVSRKFPDYLLTDNGKFLDFQRVYRYPLIRHFPVFYGGGGGNGSHNIQKCCFQGEGHMMSGDVQNFWCHVTHNVTQPRMGGTKPS